MSFQDEVYNAWASSEFDYRELATDIIAKAKRLLFIGNGGSAAIASHMANDFSKNGGIAALCFNDGAALTCLGNDLGFDHVFAHPIRQHAGAHDILVAVSSSGRSQNILRGVEAARSKGNVWIVTFSGFDDDNPLKSMGNRNYYVPSHDYGIVETIHLGMLHATLAEVARAR